MSLLTLINKARGQGMVKTEATYDCAEEVDLETLNVDSFVKKIDREMPKLLTEVSLKLRKVVCVFLCVYI